MTPTLHRRRVRWIATVFCGLICLCAVESLAGAAPGLSTDFFPAGTPEPVSAEDWQALSLRFPSRVKAARASSTDGPRLPPAEPVTVRDGITYLRVRNLAADALAVEAAASSPGLIVDLRYVSGGIEESLAFGRALSRRALRIEASPPTQGPPWSIEPSEKRSRDQVTLALVNGDTAGAIEAVLDALQFAGEILLVGSRTKGDTGRFPTSDSPGGWHVIEGEFRRSGGASLLDHGVEPSLVVEVPAETEIAAYRAFEAGTTVVSLLDAPVEKERFDEALLLEQHGGNNDRSRRTSSAGRNEPLPGSTARDAGDEAATADPPLTDRVLHRAVNALVAWNALRLRRDS